MAAYMVNVDCVVKHCINEIVRKVGLLLRISESKTLPVYEKEILSKLCFRIGLHVIQLSNKEKQAIALCTSEKHLTRVSSIEIRARAF